MTRERRRRRSRRSEESPEDPTITGGGDFKFGTDIEGMKSEYDVQENINQRIRAAGLSDIEKPTKEDERGNRAPYDGSIPDDLEALHNRELGVLLSAITRWYEYVGNLYGRADIELKSRKEVTKGVRAFLRRDIAERREADKEAGKAAQKKYLDDDEVETNPVYIQARAKELETEGYLAYLKRAYDAAENNRRAVSRQYNIREGQRGAHSREENTGRRRGTWGRRRRQDG